MSFTGSGNLLQLNEHDFDFNIQFEQLFFSIIPSVLFIVGSLWRTLSQARKPTVVDAPVFQLIKLIAIASYVGLELSLLVMAAVGSFHVTSMFLAASVLKLVSALFMIILSLFDHSKSARPSIILNSYLFLTLLVDAAQTRTLFLSSDDRPELTYSVLFSTALALKVGILLLEAQRKSKWVVWDEKEHSPEETSGIFSLGVFFWLNKMFLEGYSKVLTFQDLYPLDSALNSRSLHDQFSANLDYSKMTNDKYGLVKVLARTLKVPLLLPVFPRLALLAFTFCQPLFIQKLLDDLSKPEVDSNIGYGFIGASVLIYAGIAISTAIYWYFHHRMRSMARSILVTEIFLKATKARIGTGNDDALTLMSTDMENINLGIRPLHEIWASFIQIALAAWLLYRQLGVLFMAPIGVSVSCFLGLMLLMRFTGDSIRDWMAVVQKRVGLTSVVIGSMKNLKLSGLTAPVSEFIQQLRVDELAAFARFRKVIIIAAIFAFIPYLLSPPLTFAFTNSKLDSTRMFTSLTYLTLLTTPLSELFQDIPQLLTALACLGRIKTFLECEDREDFRQILNDMERAAEKVRTDEEISPAPNRDSTYPIVIKDGQFGWDSDNLVLKNINASIVKSSLTVVVGPVGSGKSSFCKALLGEIPCSQGSFILSTRFPHVGFCDQTAFLSNGSVKDNIIGFSRFDAERYEEIIEATALTFDLETLPQGDDTNIGSNGITLSGGQKQRVSLARALYLQSDLLILDDVFSGLDANTEEEVFRGVFGPQGFLKRRGMTAILCTHTIKYLPTADRIIALGGGIIVEQGTFDELMTKQGYVHGLKSWESSDDDSSSETKNKVSKPKKQRITNSTLLPVTESDGARQIGDRTVYKHYFKSIGLFYTTFSLVFAAFYGFFTNFPTIWLTFWSDDYYSPSSSHSWAYYAGIYALLQICALLAILVVAIVIMIVFVKKSGTSLHRNALRTLIRAPLRFFTSTETGVVTNLFSQDMNLIDSELPMALLNTSLNASMAVGQMAVIPTSSPYMAISYPFLAGLLFFVQKFYLRTARQLRLLDLEAKSPLYTHFLDTIKGIATLRAFGFISDDIRKNAHLVDSSMRPAYLLVMIQQWLILVLDIVVMVMATVLTTLAVRLHTSSGFTGAALVTLMTFGSNLSGIVVQYTKLETSIGVIARLKNFDDTVKPEDREEEDIVPPAQWPQQGAIELKGVSASYGVEDKHDETYKLTLHDINLSIKSGEKVAICGRTGSGKSSLVAVLLKLLDPTSETAANAMIDNIPLQRIDRSALRQRILAVPQEAVFLPDGTTFTQNLDPFNVSTSEECQSVLEAVNLWQFIQDRGGLNAAMSAGSLSAGQRQLMSLGRVLLRRRIRARNLGMTSEGGILLLDEVSSSVDQGTEVVMQEIVREEFRNYTVVAVSHRLDMIMDFDRVVVMDEGRIVEVGNPMVLAGKVGSRFGDLVKAGGK